MTANRTTAWFLGALPAALLILAAAWSLAVQRRDMGHSPSDGEWVQAQAIVREHFRQGDVIRTAPSWADSARARMYGYPFNLTYDAEDEELYLYDRLWILADHEHVEQAVRGLPPGYDVEQRWRPTPRTAVVLVDIPDRDRVLYDVVSGIDEAQVVRDYGDHQERCDVRHQGGWHCDHYNPWLHVTPTIEETGGSLHRCIYVGLLPDNAEHRVGWVGRELGSVIQGNVGNIMPAIRAERGADIHFRVEIDGETRDSLVFDKWARPFFPFEIDTRDLAGEQHDLTFVFSTADFFDRWVCFRARVLR